MPVADGVLIYKPEQITPQDALMLCECMEKLCITHADAEGVLLLQMWQQLRKLRAHFWKLQIKSKKQSTLDVAWGAASLSS